MEYRYIVIIILVVIAVLCLFLAKHVVFRGRKTLSDDESYVAFDLDGLVEKHKFDEVMSYIERLYGVKRGKLRPEDKLNERLHAVDSFKLGYGAERLAELLKDNLIPGISLRELVISLSKMESQRFESGDS